MEQQFESHIQEEIDFIDEIFGNFLKGNDFEVASANETVIAYANRTFVLDFCFDYRYGRMNFGGIYLTVKTTKGRYNLRDLVEHIHPKKKYSAIHAEIKAKGGIEQRVVNEILETYLDTTISAKDTSWEPSLKRALKRKYPY